MFILTFILAAASEPALSPLKGPPLLVPESPTIRPLLQAVCGLPSALIPNKLLRGWSQVATTTW